VELATQVRSISGLCARNLALAWVLTLPVAMALAGFLFWGFRQAF
jgi:phosphate/sulfate permease